MTDKKALIGELTLALSKYKTQALAAEAISSETGANYTQSNLSRMISGSASVKSVQLIIYVLRQIEMKNDNEYQYKIL